MLGVLLAALIRPDSHVAARSRAASRAAQPTRSIVRAWSCLATFLALTLACATAAGDGKVFPVAIVPPTSIPDQQALICFQDGMQTLAIETRFEGEGTEFAWVVPLPSPPEISATTSGTFASLRHVFLPVIRTIPATLSSLTGLAALLALIIWVYRPSVIRSLLVGVVGFFIATPLLLPSLGTARSIGSSVAPTPPDGVEVLQRSSVGSYDTQTIRSDSPDALVNWLNENGFGIDEASRAPIAAYVAEGWCFVATRLRRDDAGKSVMSPHPLVFRFKAERPVYPMRLTMTQREPVRLDLYVFADRAARVEGMRVESSSPVEYAAPTTRGYRRGHSSTHVRVSHESIEALTGTLGWATKLSGTIASDFEGDLPIDLHDGATFRPVRYDERSAVILGFSAGMTALAIGLGVAAFHARGSPSRPFGRETRRFALIASASAALGFLVHGLTPTAPTTSSRGDRTPPPAASTGDHTTGGRAASGPARRWTAMTEMILQGVASETAEAVAQRPPEAGAPDLAWIRAELSRRLEALSDEVLDGEARPIVGDGPGEINVVPMPDDPSLAMFVTTDRTGRRVDLQIRVPLSAGDARPR